MNTELPYEQWYWELRKALNIHESHSHEKAMHYITIANDRRRVSDQIIGKAEGFSSAIAELVKQTY